MSLLGRLLFSITRWDWVHRLFTDRRWGRRVAGRFVAGETLDDAVAVVRRLNQEGFTVSLDHLGEHVHERYLALQARDDYLACIDRIAADGLAANVSVKLTQLGLGLDDDLATESLRALAERAREAGTTVTVDMEESRHAQATLDQYVAVQRDHGNLGVAVQAYLHRTPADLVGLVGLGGHIRLCKGAYDEDEEVALRTRAEVNDAFDRLCADLMAAEGTYPAIATHDEKRIEVARRHAAGRCQPFEFQMLYGIRTALQEDLLCAGFPVRIYVPYGDAWYPYLTRRIVERPANIWFFLRALVGR